MSSERARALREAGDTFDRAEAAKQAERQASIARTNATLAHPNPVVRGMAARLLAQTDTQSNSRPGGSSSLNASSRGGRVANVASKTGANVMARAAEGKATSPGNSSRFAHLADGQRFAAFAAASDAGAAELAALPRHPAGGSPEQTAAFIMASAAKARGQKVTAPIKPPVAAKHDMSTPEGVAAFVAASAAKARGNRR